MSAMVPRKLIWFAIVWSTFIYMFLAYWFGRTPKGTFEESVKHPIVLGLSLASLAAFIAGIVVSTSMRGKNPWQAFIVALGLFEACAVFGLTAAFFMQDWRVFIPSWVLALVGFLREWPSSSE